MDRTIVQTRLAHTEVQIADGEHQVAKQRDAIDLLGVAGSRRNWLNTSLPAFCCCKPRAERTGIDY